MARNKHQAPKPTAEETVVTQQEEIVQQEPADANDQSNDAANESAPDQTTEGGTESTEQALEVEGTVAVNAEQQSDASVKEGDVVAPTPEVTPAVETTADAPVVKYDQYAGLSTTSRMFLEIVDNHIATLDPKRTVNVEAGINSQRTFANALVNIFKVKDVKDFMATMDHLIKKIADNKDGAFQFKHAFRHWAQIPMAKERLKAYEYNLSALLTLATTANRKEAFRAVDFKTAFANVGDAEQTRLVAYFKRLCGV